MKLNIRPNNKTHSIEEKVTLVNGKYSNSLKHDNVIRSTILVNSKPGLQGSNITTFTTTTPEEKPWETVINIFTDSYKEVYITYESFGDQVDADDFNYLNEVKLELEDLPDVDFSRIEEDIEKLEKDKADREHTHKATEVKFTDGDNFQDKLDKGELKGQKGDKGDEGKQGPPGKDGSDATVTKDKIVSELGYTPADEKELGDKWGKDELEIGGRNLISMNYIKNLDDRIIEGEDVNGRYIEFQIGLLRDKPISNNKFTEGSYTLSIKVENISALNPRFVVCYTDGTIDQPVLAYSDEKIFVGNYTTKSSKTIDYISVHYSSTGIVKWYELKLEKGTIATDWTPAPEDIALVDHTHRDYEDAISYLQHNKVDNSKVDNHIDSITNPHKVTKSQIGLSNVNNTADLDKPISRATQTELYKLDSRMQDLKHEVSNKVDNTNDKLGDTVNLQTENKVIVDAINEVKNSIPADADLSPVYNKIDELDKVTLKKGGITCAELRGF